MLCRACFRETRAGSAACERCGAPQRPAPPCPPAVPAAGGGGPVPPGSTWDNPWERPRGGDRLSAFGETLQRSLLHPGEFFRGTDPSSGFGAALGYAVLVGTLSLAVLALWQRALGAQIAPFLGGRGHEFVGIGPGWVLRLLVGAPLWVAFNVLFWSVVFHGALRLTGSGRGGFGATAKAVGYSCSAFALTAVPVLGWAVWLAWMAVLQVIGFRELHRTGGGRALLGWALPLLVALLAAAVLVGTLTAVVLRIWQQFGGQFEV